MNNKSKNEVNSIEKSMEIFLAGMAFNNNMPIVFTEDKTSEKPKIVGIRQFNLPVCGANYVDTINKMASNHPDYNELLLSIGIDLSLPEYNEDILFHSELIKYLVSNDIKFKLDMNKRNLVISFPNEVVEGLLDSEYKFFLEDSKEFFDQLGNENLLMRLRNYGDQKAKQLIKI